VIAGTGSIVAGLDAAGVVVTTGGLGHLLGERGSAAAIGRAALVRFLDDGGSVGRGADELEAAVGVVRADLVGTLHRSGEPAALLARAAPVVTGAAARGEPWAVDVLRSELAALAADVARHLDRYGPRRGARRVGLSGGVWSSPVAVTLFAEALSGLVDGEVAVALPVRSPAAAAVALLRA
jgi:N-acetylglucosamine kinase-like BadF-type ATPase